MKPLLGLAMTVVALMGIAPPIQSQTRLASDYEMARMREQIARSSDFLAQLSGRMNLGDLHLGRNEVSIAREEYGRALTLAERERVTSRHKSDLAAYATATAYAGLAQAKLGNGSASFNLFEEALRYASHSAKTWNLFATAMTVLDRPAKGIAAARNAVAIAAADLKREPSTEARLDLAIYEHALATSLIDDGFDAEAEALLRRVIESLASDSFTPLRNDIARSESFEIYSTALGETAAYLSLLNRAQLRLGALLERKGDRTAARDVYRRVLEQRTDDPHALQAFARLSSDRERARWFVEAFDANPFSSELIAAYRRHLASAGEGEYSGTGTGGRLRRALRHMERGETRAARRILDDLLRQFPANATLQALDEEIRGKPAPPDFLTGPPAGPVVVSGAELRRLIVLAAGDHLTAAERTVLDGLTFSARVSFDAAVAEPEGHTVFASGKIDGLPFRFSQPASFLGSFEGNAPLRLFFRFIGATASGDADAVLLEPIRVEVTP